MMDGLMKSKYVKREYECSERIDQLRIDSKTDAIRITSGDVMRVRISYWENPGKYEYSCTEADGKLTLAFDMSRGILGGIHCTFKDTTIEVVVPRDFAGSMDVKCTSGKIELTDIHTENISIGCTSGLIRLSDVVSQGNITIDNKSGSIKLSEVKATKDVSVMNKSGLIRVNDLQTEGAFLSGNTSGGIHFENLKTGGSIHLKSTSGSVKGSIIGKEEDYSILAGTKTGMNNLTNSRNGGKELNVKVTSGSIKIQFV